MRELLTLVAVLAAWFLVRRVLSDAFGFRN
jgi:hypothetical protein